MKPEPKLLASPWSESPEREDTSEDSDKDIPESDKDIPESDKDITEKKAESGTLTAEESELLSLLMKMAGSKTNKPKGGKKERNSN